MPEGYHYYPLATEMNLDVLTAVAQILYLNGGSLLLASGNGLRKHTGREWQNISENAAFDQVVHYDGYENYMDRTL